MKLLYPDIISIASSSSEDSNYPIENILNVHPQKYWKADTGVTSATITIVSGGDFKYLHVENTNAATILLSIKDSTEATTYETQTLTSSTYPRYWFSLSTTYTASAMHIVLSLSGPSTLYAGVARLGEAIELNDPNYGLTNKRTDYSIKEELSNGGLYVYKRNTPREYSLNITDLETKYDEIDLMYNDIGSEPIPVLISDDLNNNFKWSGFFHIIDPPNSSYEFYNYVNIGLTLREAI